MPNDIIRPELLDLSITFARFASAAYLDTDARRVEGLKRVTCEKRFNEESSPNKTDTQAFVCKWDKDVVVAFRGTENRLSDWWTDLKGELVANPTGVGRIHKGFKAAADSIYRYIAEYIPKIADPESRLFVCGHSLGGALALIIAERFATDAKLPQIAGVFTYGAPRVGDTNYVTAYRQTSAGKVTNMWVASGDPVTRVAPHSFDYRHAAAKQFTLDEGAIGQTDLDSLIAIQSEKDEFAKYPMIQGAIGVFSRLKNAFQNLDSAEHSINDSYLKQLVAAKQGT